MNETNDMQATIERAFSIVEQVCDVLEGAADCPGRAKALRAFREAHVSVLASLVKEIRQYPLEQLKPAILVEQQKHQRLASAFDLAMKCEKDAEFMAEWKIVYDLFGG